MDARPPIETCPVCLGQASRDPDMAVPPDGDGIRCPACAPKASGYYWMSRTAQTVWERSNPTSAQREKASAWIRSLPASSGSPPEVIGDDVQGHML